MARYRIRRKSAVVIQTRMRVVLAKSRVIRLKASQKLAIDRLVTRIQKNVRRKLAVLLVGRMRAEEEAKRAEIAGKAGKGKGKGSKDKEKVLRIILAQENTFI